MHGYELRKRLNALLGTFRAFGYGSLYPCLKELLAQGLIAEESPAEARPAGPSRPGGQARYSGQARQRSGRRSKIVYRLTADGKERLQDLLAESGPAAWDDDGFGVHFAFFGQTRADIRLRILEGRRTRLEERLDGVRAAMSRTRERLDRYTLELHRHGLESVEREVRWLNELIASERESGATSPPHSARTAENGT
jgi:DNA-binding PadR family transcriptional regulator